MAEFRGFSGEFRDSLSCSVGILLVVALVIVSVSCGSRDSSQIEREKALKERVEEESKRSERAADGGVLPFRVASLFFAPLQDSPSHSPDLSFTLLIVFIFNLRFYTNFS